MFTVLTRTTRRVALGGLALAAMSAQPAFAQNADLAVSAEVVETCRITTLPIEFGTIDVTTATDHDADGSFTVTCTAGTTWAASADAGENSTDVTARKLASGTDRLNYGIFTNVARTTNFGGATTIPGLATGLPIPTPVYGRVPGSQTGVPAGTYADSVTITLTL